MRNKKGITLIALIITIIVLIILAGISLSIVMGDNGILKQAKNAKEKTEISGIIEIIRTDIKGVQAGNNGEISESEFNTILTKHGTVSGENEDKILTTENGYIIKVSDIYDGIFAGGSNGKKVAELYDGINDVNAENYNEDAMHIGDYVNYTAGAWNETKAAPTSEDPFSFGGYTIGQSRDSNASGSYINIKNGVTYGEGKYDGWRIWDISEDKQTITLISAGCPEVFYHPSGFQNGLYYAYITEYILTGNVHEDLNGLDLGFLGFGTTYLPRDWNMYKNADLYASSARTIQKSDLESWYKKYIDNSVSRLYCGMPFTSNFTESRLFSIVENGFYYWLSSQEGNDFSVVYFSPDIPGLFAGSNNTLGVRVLVTLTSEVKFEETPRKVEQDGIVYNKWIIENK